MIKILTRLFAISLLVAGLIALVGLVNSNRQLSEEVNQLEAELGQMTIEDPEKIYLVAIEDPEIPPEVSDHVDHIWQYRCYLPANYDFKRMSGSGKITEEGVYFQGGFGSSWSSPKNEPRSVLLTVSLTEKTNSIECFVKFDHSSGTTGWNWLTPEKELPKDLVIETLVQPGDPARSFDQDDSHRRPEAKKISRRTGDQRDSYRT